jgi:programmed cell death protein 5
MVDDSELEMIRRRRLQQLEADQRLGEEMARRQALEEEEMAQQRQSALRQIMAPDARERLGRLRMAHPDLASSVEDQLLALAQSGRLGKQVTDADLRNILRRLAPTKREISITFKK